MVHTRAHEQARLRVGHAPDFISDAAAEHGTGATIAAGVAVLGAVAVGLAADQGGYFPTSWGWATLALASVAALSVILGSRARIGLQAFGFAGALALFVAWVGISAWWSSDVTATSHDLERTAIYASAALLVPAVFARRRADSLVATVFVVIAGVSLFSLLTRLFPAALRITDAKALARLAQPIGYWNGLACFASIGIVLAFGYAAAGGRAAVRCAAAAVVVVLSTTVYFTFSRAAWIALAVGCAFFLAFARGRTRAASTMLFVGAPAAVAVLLASRTHPLTAAHVSLDVAAPAGRHLALKLAVLCIAAAAVAAAIPAVAAALAPYQRLKRAYTVTLVVAPTLLAVVAIMLAGGPAHLARSAYDAFRAPPPTVNNLNDRLLNFSSDGRVDLWRVAWTNFRDHPIVGSGAGTYQRYFLAHQPPTVGSVTDAHNLYLETASELGVIGLALLVVALILPLSMLPRARSHPLAAGAAGAYVVFLTHAAADWDWELPAVTLPVIVLGAFLFHVGVKESPSPAIRRAFVVVPAAAVLALIGLVGLGGNIALASSADARDGGNISRGIDDARRAHRWFPWSAEPWKALALAEAAGGDTRSAQQALRHAAKLDPGDWEVWAELAGVTKGRERVRARMRAAALYIQGGFGTPPGGDDGGAK
jgi:O-antigen ligase